MAAGPGHHHADLVVEPPRHTEPSDRDSLAVPRGITLEEVERRYLEDALAGHDGDLTSLAGDLGISRKTLWEKRRRFLILRSAEMLKPGGDVVKVDGEVVIDRANVDFIQVVN